MTGTSYLQFSRPIKNPDDRYYYQQYRYLDFSGNVIGYGNVLKSWEPNSRLGLFEPALDGFKMAGFAGKLGAAGWSLIDGNLGGAARAAASAIKDYNNGLEMDWGSWPGTDTPWIAHDAVWQRGAQSSTSGVMETVMVLATGGTT
jgi:hypothetical protein